MASQIFPVPGPSQDAFNAVSDQIGNIQQYQTTCLKNGGKLQFSCSNTTQSIWLISTARGTGTSYAGCWLAVCGSTSGMAQPLITAGGNVSLAFDSTSNKLTLTNSSTSEDVYVSAIRIYGTGTLTMTKA